MEKPSQWQRIKEIVGTALEQEPSRRGVYLDEACADDSGLRAEVDSLLSAYEKSDDLSRSPFAGARFDVPVESQSMGPYRLIKKLGEGGMGQVWLAEQTAPVRRQVALKLIRAGMLHSDALQRFQAERQSLALMDHPAIAKVFDAGATPNGQPFFVMEYVEGRPITEFCDQKKLILRERLQLFIQVCEAVQHAHQKAVIHRDLKPANILVAEIDGKPRPRIIDFGLAKAAAPLVPGETLFTQAGAFLGTPGYMSPEQTDPGAQDIDTRADVYSLGVILYELLAGSLPFDTERLKKEPLDKLVRILREEDPPTPSAKLRNDPATSTVKAQARGTEAHQLVTLLSGDLDWITMKALEKDRERRYGTPFELAADIERHLQNRPILARPASAGYRVRKYIRRNRAGVAVAAGAMSLLIAFAVMQAIQLRRITRERDRANRVTDFMTSMFKVSDPSEARGNSVTAREILDKSSKEIETGLAKDPELQAQMMNVMGEVYLNLGLYPQAQSLIEQAIQIRRRTYGVRNRETLDSMDKLAWIFQEQGKFEQAEKIEREILPIRSELFGPEDRDTLGSEMNLANAVSGQGRNAESEQIDRAALAIRRRILPEDRMTLIEMSNLAATLEDMGRYQESEQLLDEALPIMNRTLGPEHPFTIKARSNLADVYDREGRFAEAEQITRELLEIRRRVLGPNHPDTLTNAGDVGTLLYEEGRFAEAEVIHREILEIQKRVTGPEHPRTLSTMSNLANDLAALHRYVEAEQLSQKTWEIQRRVLGAEHPYTLDSAVSLAAIYRKEGRYAEAEKLMRQTLEIQRRVLGSNHPVTIDSAYSLAGVLALEHKREEALATLRDAIEHGYANAEHLEKDDDLKSLRGDPRFDELVAAVKKKPPA